MEKYIAKRLNAKRFIGLLIIGEILLISLSILERMNTKEIIKIIVIYLVMVLALLFISTILNYLEKDKNGNK